MGKRHFKNWIAGYLKYTANTEAPTRFHWWTAISTIAGALQRKVYLDMHSFEWVPNFYIVLVGPAGLVTKSTSLRLGEKLLRGVRKVRFGSQSGSWQALAMEIADTGHMSIAGGLHTCPISYFISEFGTFFDPTNREQIDFFVDSWDAQRTSFTRTTKSSGKMEIHCPCVNILAGTTPTWVRENFTPTMISGGFASRVIFVRGAAKAQFIPYPNRSPQAEDFTTLQKQLTADLVEINKLEGPMTLTEDAYEWGTNWYKEHYTLKRQLVGERFDGFYARKQTHLHKLAMILSIAEGDSMKVTSDHLQMANGIILEVEKDLASIVDNITNKQISTLHKREILSVIGTEGEIDRDKLYAMLYQMMSGPDFDKSINDLSKAQQISIQPKGGKTMLSLKAGLTLVKK